MRNENLDLHWRQKVLDRAKKLHYLNAKINDSLKKSEERVTKTLSSDYEEK